MSVIPVAVPDHLFIARDANGVPTVWADEGPRYVSTWPRCVMGFYGVDPAVVAILEQTIPLRRMPHEVEVVHDGAGAEWGWQCAHRHCGTPSLFGYETEEEAEESAQAHRRETSDFPVEELARG